MGLSLYWATAYPNSRKNLKRKSVFKTGFHSVEVYFDFLTCFEVYENYQIVVNLCCEVETGN